MEPVDVVMWGWWLQCYYDYLFFYAVTENMIIQWPSNQVSAAVTQLSFKIIFWFNNLSIRDKIVHFCRLAPELQWIPPIRLSIISRTNFCWSLWLFSLNSTFFSISCKRAYFLNNWMKSSIVIKNFHLYRKYMAALVTFKAWFSHCEHWK